MSNQSVIVGWRKLVNVLVRNLALAEEALIGTLDGDEECHGHLLDILDVVEQSIQSLRQCVIDVRRQQEKATGRVH